MSTANRQRLQHISIALLSLTFVSLLVVRTSRSAFMDTTENLPNQWTSGSVVLVDDDLASAMFSANNMVPGSLTNCIEVTYQGSLNANVVLYGALTAGDGLDAFLGLTVERGTGGSFGDCTGFSLVETVYTGTLSGFMTDHTGFGDGAGTWAPTGGAPDDNMTYRFTVTLPDDNAAQGKTSTATFTWEAQNI